MTSDYLFKFLLQSDTKVLKAIVCAFLNLNPNDIRNIQVVNAITLADDPSKKEMILDIKAELNDNMIINLEMQVINHHDWPERSISYLCRCFDNLHPGQGYHRVKGAYHLGFLDYTLFPESPEFYAAYQLRNVRTNQLYTSKFCISVVDLTQINLATDEDRQHHRHLWASFFKAESWEDLIMLSQQDSNIKQAVTTVYQLSQDEKFRQQYQAREDFDRQQIDLEYWFNTEIAKREATITEQSNTITELSNTITEQGNTITELSNTIAELQASFDAFKQQLDTK
jgi:predicted transposase/invertase (TIGR01784 family)